MSGQKNWERENFERNKECIDIKTVDYIEINNQPSLHTTSKILTKTQEKAFIDKFNNAKSGSLIKSIPRFFITVHFKDGNSRLFHSSENYLKTMRDWAIDLGDSTFIKTIWEELNVDHIQNIRTIFEDYIQYDESTDSPGSKDLMANSLKSLTRISNPTDLELLINVWMYYDPTDFPTRDLVVEVLQTNKAKSIEAIQKRMNEKQTWEHENGAPFSELKHLMEYLKKG